MHIHHRRDRSLTVRHGETEVLTYVYRPDTDPRESPKPLFHPVRTLGGSVVTAFRPHDHTWHQGIQMTCAELSGQNFWGGVTWVTGEGYRWLENFGRQLHRGEPTITEADDAVTFDHAVQWRTMAGEHWLDERRTWSAGLVSDRAWSLDVQMAITNVCDRTLEFGSPTTAGRPNAGYGGLFWRGPRDMGHQARVLLADGTGDADAAMGAKAAWLAYLGKHDETQAETTLVFADQPDSARYPCQWFVRTGQTPVASFAFMFDEVYPLPPGETLRLHHRLYFVDGHLDADAVETLLQR